MSGTLTHRDRVIRAIPLALGALVAAGWLLVLVAGAATPNPHSDFVGYYTAARLFQDGVSPYDRHAQIALRAELLNTSPDARAIQEYFYPPVFLLLILPFTALSVGAASLLWLCLQIWSVRTGLGPISPIA